MFLYLPQNETQDFVPSAAEFSLAGTYLAPLDPYRDHISVIDNLVGSGGHSAGHSEWLSGWVNGWVSEVGADVYRPRGGPTLDLYIADRLGGGLPLPTLSLTVGPERLLGLDSSETSWRRLARPGEDPSRLESAEGEVVAVPHVRSAVEGFRLVYGQEPGMTDPEAALRLARDRSLLDGVAGEYQRIAARLSAADRRVLEAHMTLLREHEARLAGGTGASCEGGVAPTETDDIELHTRAHLDTILGALRCDATRVATFAFGPSGSSTCFPRERLGLIDFHEIAHGNPAYTSDWRGDHFRVREWHAQQVAYFIDQLATTPEGDGTLLDNTLVAWLPELGWWEAGMSGNSHTRRRVPVLLAGGGGRIQTGRVIDSAGAHYHGLLLTLAHAMGLTDTRSFGEAGTAVIDGVLT